MERVSGLEEENTRRKSRYMPLFALDKRCTVWLVRDMETDNVLIRKEIDPETLGVYRKLFGVHSPYIAKVVGIETGENVFFIYEEYIQGNTIADLLCMQGCFSEEEAICHIRHILEGLQEVHRLGIVHRDITASNVMISNDGIAKLVDFGISREYKKNQTTDTTILGTPGYAAPEQFGFQQSDGKTDIYGVGVLLNEMLTGKKIGDGICGNRKLAQIINRATAIDPKERFRDAGEMIKALEYEKIYKTDFFVPGFRSGNRLYEGIATIYYLSAMGFIFIMSLWLPDGEPFQLRHFVGLVLVFLMAPVVALGVSQWDRRLWGIKDSPKGFRAMIRIAAALCVAVIGLFIVGTFD